MSTNRIYPRKPPFSTSHLPISYFSSTHFYSVNGVGEPCQSSEHPSIRGESSLTHFPLPTYPFIFRERCRWTVSAFEKSFYQRGIFTYPFPTSHLLWKLIIFILRGWAKAHKCLPIYIPWTVSVVGGRWVLSRYPSMKRNFSLIHSLLLTSHFLLINLYLPISHLPISHLSISHL